MAQLSELVSRFRQQNAPTARGHARGGIGSTGAVPFQGRNVDAGIDKERQIMESPEFNKFGQFVRRTPVTDYLKKMVY